MTPELWARLKPLYSAAIDLPEQGRTQYIEQMCAGDPELGRELLALIAANQSAANTLDPPLADFGLFRPLRSSILEPGTMLASRFRIVRHLGSGGMGDVYEAIDLELQQGRIALKTLRPEIAGNPDALARFKDEVLLARKITGPNICRIHELYLTGNKNGSLPIAFLTMELLDGVTLHDYIEQKSPLPVAEIRRLAEQLCGALCCIHEAGIIHRDLKTRNVMLVPHAGSDKVVVMDFGLARTSAPGNGSSGANAQQPALVVGTPSYMAPEQFEGREAGPPTDIYALGLILYEMATGVQPFAAHTPLAAAIRRSQSPRYASSMRHELPPAWDDIIARCLEYEPEKRFQSATAVSEALKHHGKLVLRLGNQRRLAIPRIALLAAGLVLIVAAAATAWIFIREAQRRKLTPEAAHWYALGMTALREGSYLKATGLLNEVTQRDPTYAVAHAALADAWSELDFTEPAQREMLMASAPAEQRGLSDIESRYIDAVRATLVRDYSAAAQDYEAILKQDPQERKADDYVDLGRIYEKAGKVNETVASYEKAAQLNPDDPAPFLHLGILESRLRKPEAAARDFAHAEELYRAGSDLEGLAEVAFQNGYAANEAANSDAANQYLNKSLAIARQIPSVQLQVRSLSQLSSVAYNDSKDDQAIAYANQVIDLAREQGLEYWVTDGIIRLASSYLDKEDYPHAEAEASEALRRAREKGHPRLEANALLTLASVSFQQQRWDDDIRYAQGALPYFRDYGFLAPADRALTLIARGERNKGNYQQALSAGNQLLANAERTHSAENVMLAEELIGGSLLSLERYPDALSHFQHALGAAESVKEGVAYQHIHCAEVLWHLGRYAEASDELAQVPTASRSRLDNGTSIAGTEAGMDLSRLNAEAALAAVRNTRQQFPDLGTKMRSTHLELLKIEALAEAQLGHADKANQAEAQLAALIDERPNPLDRAKQNFVQASIELRFSDAPAAKRHAEAAEITFAQIGTTESDALSLLTAAEAAKAMGDAADADTLSKKSVDIFRHMAQSWGVPTFQTYTTRPDLQQALRTLSSLRAAHGDSVGELSR